METAFGATLSSKSTECDSAKGCDENLSSFSVVHVGSRDESHSPYFTCLSAGIFATSIGFVLTDLVHLGL
jgi:hypothetical protein